MVTMSLTFISVRNKSIVLFFRLPVTQANDFLVFENRMYVCIGKGLVVWMNLHMPVGNGHVKFLWMTILVVERTIDFE